MAKWKDFVGGPIWWRNKSNMADGRHLGFRILAIISASINIFAPNLVQWWKIVSPRGSSSQKSDLRNSKMADSRHLGFRFWAIIPASINIFSPNFVPRWKIGNSMGSKSQKSDFRKSNMADGRHLGFRFRPIIRRQTTFLHKIWHSDGKAQPKVTYCSEWKIQDNRLPPSWI